jgi:hypothetical protein
MRRLALGVFSLALFCVAFAAVASSRSRQAEASMLVTGTIVVAPDGSVRSYALDHAKNLPVPVVDLINKGIPAWRFEPTLLDGQPVAAKAKMSLRVVAQPQNNGDYAISISGAQFNQGNGVDDVADAYIKRTPLPVYPGFAIREHLSGSVYLLLRVNRQGKVIDGFAEKVNLDTNPQAIPPEGVLNKGREVLAKASLDAVLKWTFNMSTSDANSKDDYQYARVPINFYLDSLVPSPARSYGEWVTYMPGPIQQAPWGEKSKLASNNVDAIPEGSVSLADEGLHLITPLGGS